LLEFGVLAIFDDVHDMINKPQWRIQWGPKT
jgi:hypothetical protein